MRKYIFNGLAALTMGLAMTSCMKEFSFEEQEQQASLDNAQQTLGFYIPANQDWVMSTTATATFNVKGLSDEATLYVFSNYPEGAGYGSVLASGKMTGTTTTLTDFRIPSYLKQIFVGLQQSDGSIMYKYVDVEDGNINVDYDFSSTTKARTRANAVIDGDPFTFENTANYYKTEIPKDAKDINTTSDYDCIQAGTLYATNGMRTGNNKVNLWMGPAVDIYINGDVTIPSDAYIYSANIYVLPGSTLTMNKQANYVCRVFVSENATLNYTLEKLETNNDNTGKYSAIYNKGTVNLADDFKASNDVVIYNEGTMNGTAITSNPADGNPSYFYNFGELNLTSDLQLNSTANFYNEGTVFVDGLTSCTQGKNQVWWINKGHYTTGEMTFSAKNTTFYNYCQLVVKGNAHMYDGAFNLMNGSYTEAGTAEFDNFYVNLGSNSGFNVKGDSYWGQNGDGEFQGFNSTGDNNYVRLGGTTTISEHRYSLVTTGNIKIAFKEKVDLGANNSGVWPTFDRRDNSKVVDFSELNVTPNDGDCGATWSESPSVVENPTENNWWTYAFEDRITKCDFDMNDVVIQVKENESNPDELIVKLVAAGCEFDNYVWLGDNLISWNGKAEVHEALGASHGEMVNTGNGKGVYKDPVVTTIAKPADFVDLQKAKFRIRPFRIGTGPDDLTLSVTSDFIGIVEETTKGEDGKIAKAPLGIAIPTKWKWPLERVIVTDAYPTPDDNSHSGFATYGSEEDPVVRIGLSDWYNYPVSDKVSK